ncbi:MAG: hypothetical protein QOG19_3439, partial [Mycobacterium sp.]|nr:hypothetical protein [Mycobacterium sp.]
MSRKITRAARAVLLALLSSAAVIAIALGLAAPAGASAGGITYG